MKVKDLIKELKKKDPESKVFVMVHKTIKKGIHHLEEEIPVFEDEKGNEDKSFTMLSIDHDKK